MWYKITEGGKRNGLQKISKTGIGRIENCGFTKKITSQKLKRNPTLSAITKSQRTKSDSEIHLLNGFGYTITDPLKN